MISPSFPIQKNYNDTWVWAELHQAATQADENGDPYSFANKEGT